MRIAKPGPIGLSAPHSPESEGFMHVISNDSEKSLKPMLAKPPS
jgi:hypothetical protein